jgi:flagellar L-ring protein precursor FlgH
MNKVHILTYVVAAEVAALAPIAAAQTAPPAGDSASSSLLVTTPIELPPPVTNDPPHALRMTSMFAIAPPKPRTFQVHDLVQIIVRETSEAKSSQDLQTKKDSKLDGKVGAWPNFNLSDLLNLQLHGGRTDNLPEAKIDFTNDFKGQGDYERKDDLTARLTAEIVEVQPNGNLVLEARTFIKTDKEEQSIKATGICRSADITAANTILSNQLHDLTIEKMHKGELREAGQKGIIAKVLETVFAF